MSKHDCMPLAMVDRYRPRRLRARRSLSFAVLLLLALAGCAAMGVVETSDPYRKLAQAERLMGAGRIGVARRLILESMEMFERQGNPDGLAEAYRSYGFLLRQYGDDVVLDLDVSRSAREASNDDGRIDKSIAYFQKSLAIAKDKGWHDKMANLHYNIAVNHHFAGRLDQACLAFSASLEAYQDAQRTHPGRAVELPDGVASFAALIDRAKKEIGCR